MTSTRSSLWVRGDPDGALARLVRRAAGAAARRPRMMIVFWLVFVVGCVAAGAMTGTQSLTDSEAGTGESARADARIAAAGLERPASESILVRSGDPARTRAAAAALEARLDRPPEVGAVRGPDGTSALSTAGGRIALVQVALRGDPDDAADNVAPVETAVSEVARAYPEVTFQEAGDGTIDKTVEETIEDDLRRAEMISLPIIAVVLVFAFGALVAASVPLLLGVTSVAAALGVAGVISQVAPSYQSTGALVVLIGLAVGVDYSLFYIRREREERRAGKGPRAALDATAATVGRAVAVSGLTVMVALGGLLLTGLAVFTSMALATIVVVGVSVVGSVTVLPAVLALLGNRVDKGRIPFLGRRRPGAGRGAWARLAGAVTRRPAAALVTAVCVLGALAVPAFDLHTASADESAFPADTPVVVANRAIERAFPGAPSDAQLVVTGRGLDAPGAQQRLLALGERAIEVTGGRGSVRVEPSRDGRTAVVSVPMPDRGFEAAKERIDALRNRVAPTAGQVAPGAEVLVTGEAANSTDFTDRLSTSTPIVLAAVLGLALVLLIAAFGSLALAAAVVGLNLLSVAAAYGVLVAVFQHDWAEGLLDFTSTGTIADWLPLFAFVILFGLSMDYTILVLERIREARRAGRSARAAAAEGVAATAGTVTSAAIIMVAVFSVFATMQFADFKQLGVGLGVAVLLDATIVRGVALPAAVTLIGERRWRVPPRTGAPPSRDDSTRAPVLASGSGAR
jgi:uncharacterized membrane protein YdfJ with MMPL/SSD domain